MLTSWPVLPHSCFFFCFSFLSLSCFLLHLGSSLFRPGVSALSLEIRMSRRHGVWGRLVGERKTKYPREYRVVALMLVRVIICGSFALPIQLQ